MDDGADLGQMNGGRLAHWAVRFRLQQCIDERAALERGLVKPAVENVEDGQQPRFWIRRAAFNLGLEPGACPHDLASVEKCNRQIGLRIEVAVEAGLGTARLCQDGIDADLINPVRTEQILGRVEDALARSGRGSDSLCSQSAFPRDSP